MEDLSKSFAAFFIVGTVALLFLMTTARMILRRRRRAGGAALRGMEGPAPPPVVSGVSLLASLPTLLARGPPGALHGLHAKLGSVFTISVFGLKKVTFLVGPEATAHFFQGSESEIRQSDIYKVTVPVLGPGVAFDVDFATRSRQISLCTDAIKPVNLRGHVDAMVDEVAAYFARWGQHGVVDLKHEMGRVVLLIANRCFLGKQFRRDSVLLGEVAALIDELFANGFNLVSLLYPYLPTPAHRRRDRARARLGELIHEEVRSRRTSPSARGAETTDVMQRFIESRYVSGRPMTESEIAGLLVSMIFAAQHTSSSTGVWTGACLLGHEGRAHLAAAVEEQDQIVRRHGDRRALDYGLLRREMPTLHCCIKEALRLHPPSSLLIRHASKGFAIRTREGGSYQVPQGHTLVTCTTVGNRLPHIYRDPDVFDPSRFGPGREEDKAAGKFSYTPFGGGRHACLGEEYAYMQIKVIWSHLLRNFELELVSPFPEDEWDKFIPGPRGKVMVRYNRRRMDRALS